MAENIANDIVDATFAAGNYLQGLMSDDAKSKRALPQRKIGKTRGIKESTTYPTSADRSRDIERSTCWPRRSQSA